MPEIHERLEGYFNRASRRIPEGGWRRRVWKQCDLKWFIFDDSCMDQCSIQIVAIFIPFIAMYFPLSFSRHISVFFFSGSIGDAWFLFSSGLLAISTYISFRSFFFHLVLPPHSTHFTFPTPYNIV